MSSNLLYFDILLAAALLAQTSCRDAPGCPTTSSKAYITLDVFSATDGGVVTGIEAALTGPPTISMSCDGYRCSYYGEEVAGGYTLHVSAPGFEAASVPATIRVTSLQCGVYVTLEPGRLVLNPSEDLDASVGDASDRGMH